MTPLNVLLANPTLDGDDAVILSRLLASGADPGCGMLGAAGLHPLVQLCDRDTDEVELVPLFDALLDERDSEDTQTARTDLTSQALPDGRSPIEYVRTGEFPHRHSKTRLRERFDVQASPTQRGIGLSTPPEAQTSNTRPKSERCELSIET